MNIEASIIPGESAAGILLGSPIEKILKEQEPHFISEEVVTPFITRYRSAMVDLWVREEIVDQIMIHDGYRGKLLDKIGLRSTIADIERQIGAWEEDDEDNLVIRDLPGMIFDIEGYFPDLRDPAFLYAPIKEIYVFSLSLPS